MELNFLFFHFLPASLIFGLDRVGRGRRAEIEIKYKMGMRIVELSFLYSSSLSHLHVGYNLKK